MKVSFEWPDGDPIGVKDLISCKVGDDYWFYDHSRHLIVTAIEVCGSETIAIVDNYQFHLVECLFQ